MKKPPYRYKFMLLGKTKKVMYIQIPKNGSQSIMHMMIKTIGASEQEWTDIKKVLPNEDEYIKFTMVRNPWDRIISAYQDRVCRNWRANRLAYYGYTQRMPFRKFIELTCSLKDDNIDHHMRSQSWFTKFKSLDFIGKIESEVDWKHVTENIIGAKKTLVRNTCKHKDRFTLFADKSLRDMVEERYQEDIELFNYKFEETDD